MDNVTNNEELVEMIYDYKTRPKWYLAILFGFQHFITMSAPNALSTLILVNLLCVKDDSHIKSELISTSFFIMGITTLMQTFFGTRLPIIQGSTFAILLPTITLMKMPEINNCSISGNIYMQRQFTNQTMPQSVFHMKMRLISGAMMVSSLLEILLGCTGLVKYIVRMISPLSLASIYTVLSLSILHDLINMMAKQWAISLTGTVAMVLMILVLYKLAIPFPLWTKVSGCSVKRVKIFEKSPILLSIVFVWFLCFILTISGFLTNIPDQYGYFARTDIKLNAIYHSPIFKIPYPFQWGMPLIIPSAIIGMCAGILISIIESIGDYMITAEVCNCPKLPEFAVCRGILVEGFGVLLSGLFGSAVGPTSYSDNIGVLKITKAGNRVITQVAAILMLICGISPMLCSIFVSIPDPAVGGVAIVICMMIMGVGIANLQIVNLKSTRNALIYSLSVAFGLFIPPWCQNNVEKISIGYGPIDEIIRTLLSISLFIATVLSVFLDNFIPGNYGYIKEIEIEESKIKDLNDEMEQFLTYDGFLLEWMANKWKFLQHFALFPSYMKLKRKINSVNISLETI